MVPQRLIAEGKPQWLTDPVRLSPADEQMRVGLMGLFGEESRLHGTTVVLGALPKGLKEYKIIKPYFEYTKTLGGQVGDFVPAVELFPKTTAKALHPDVAKIKADVERIGYEATERKWGRMFSTEKAWADFKSNYSVSGESIISQTEG